MPQGFRIRLALSSCIFAAFAALVAGCGGDPPATIRAKFDAIVQNDFKTIIGELPKSSLRDSVYFKVVEYKQVDKGEYRVKAIVDFFYLKGVGVKRTVKYRYVKGPKKWERFANDYISY